MGTRIIHAESSGFSGWDLFFKKAMALQTSAMLVLWVLVIGVAVRGWVGGVPVAGGGWRSSSSWEVEWRAGGGIWMDAFWWPRTKVLRSACELLEAQIGLCLPDTVHTTCIIAIMSWLILNIGTQAENCANKSYFLRCTLHPNIGMFLPKSQGTTSALPESKCRNPHPDFDNNPSSNQDIIDIGFFLPNSSKSRFGKGSWFCKLSFRGFGIFTELYIVTSQGVELNCELKAIGLGHMSAYEAGPCKSARAFQRSTTQQMIRYQQVGAEISLMSKKQSGVT